MIKKLDISISFSYLSIVKIAGFFLLTMILKAASSDSWISPVILTQGKSPFYLRIVFISDSQKCISIIKKTISKIERRLA